MTAPLRFEGRPPPLSAGPPRELRREIWNPPSFLRQCRGGIDRRREAAGKDPGENRGDEDEERGRGEAPGRDVDHDRPAEGLRVDHREEQVREAAGGGE